MLNYSQLKSFAEQLEYDQLPTMGEHREIQATAYDEGRHIYSINFEVGLLGTVTIKMHVQWGVMEQLLLNPDRMVRWSSDAADALHIYTRFPDQPDAEYTAVLFKDDLKVLWERINYESYPFPEEDSAEDIWVNLYNRGVWEM